MTRAQQLLVEVGRLFGAASWQGLQAAMTKFSLLKTMPPTANCSANCWRRVLYRDRGMQWSEALQMIEQTLPDILLLDIGMPVLDGFAVVRAIRENPRLAALPVLALRPMPCRVTGNAS